MTKVKPTLHAEDCQRELGPEAHSVSAVLVAALLAVVIGMVFGMIAAPGGSSQVSAVGITGHDLRMAYDRCVGIEYRGENGLQNRIACTAAVYGGSASSPVAPSNVE